MNYSPTFAEARALHQAGRLSEAEHAYSSLLESSPENPQLLYLAGAVAFQLQKFDQANKNLQKASILAPQDPNIWLLRGQLEEISSNWKRAREFYDRVLQLFPSEASAMHRRALTLEMDGEVDAASQGFRQALEAGFTGVKVESYSALRNIYHCCTQKTASQWIRRIFSDPEFYKATGLLMQPYVQLGLNRAELTREWPAGTAVTHLYVGYDKFSEMPKPGDFRAFFILRDPRDCVVSWYYSARFSHNSAHPILWLRQQLESRSEPDGFVFMIDWMDEVGFFAAQRSWVESSQDDSNNRIFRYESLNQTPDDFIDELFGFLEIPMPTDARQALSDRHAWKNLSSGREKGQQDINSHYRKAKVGDWKDNFTVSTLSHFKNVTKDLVSVLEYEE